MGRMDQWVKVLQMNQKVPGPKLISRPARFRDPTSLWDPWRPSGRNLNKAVINIG